MSAHRRWVRSAHLSRSSFKVFVKFTHYLHCSKPVPYVHLDSEPGCFLSIDTCAAEMTTRAQLLKCLHKNIPTGTGRSLVWEMLSKTPPSAARSSSIACCVLQGVRSQWARFRVDGEGPESTSGSAGLAPLAGLAVEPGVLMPAWWN